MARLHKIVGRSGKFIKKKQRNVIKNVSVRNERSYSERKRKRLQMRENIIECMMKGVV